MKSFMTDLAVCINLLLRHSSSRYGDGGMYNMCCGDFLQDKVYLCLTASDSPSQDLAQYFTQCNDFIHKARLEGGSVLVHW